MLAPAAMPESLCEQVLVAAFPGTAPDVHLASIDSTTKTVSFKEASVKPSGEVALGEAKTVNLAEVVAVDSSEGVLALMNRSGNVVVQLHIEEEDDQKEWENALGAIVGNVRNSAAADQDSGADDGADIAAADTTALNERSAQLHTRAKVLEDASQRNDKSLREMLSRLDNAMKMLTAVQEMCMQQGTVIQAQKVAITELNKECGFPLQAGLSDDEKQWDQALKEQKEKAATALPLGGGGQPVTAMRSALPNPPLLQSLTQQPQNAKGQAEDLLKKLSEMQEMMAMLGINLDDVDESDDSGVGENIDTNAAIEVR